MVVVTTFPLWIKGKSLRYCLCKCYIKNTFLLTNLLVFNDKRSSTIFTTNFPPTHSVILWLFISRLVSFFLHPSFGHSTALNRHSDWCFLNHNWIINCNVIMIQSAKTYNRLKKRETWLTAKQSVNWRFRIYEKKCEIYVWLVDNNDISKNGDKY